MSTGPTWTPAGKVPGWKRRGETPGETPGHAAQALRSGVRHRARRRIWPRLAARPPALPVAGPGRPGQGDGVHRARSAPHLHRPLRPGRPQGARCPLHRRPSAGMASRRDRRRTGGPGPFRERHVRAVRAGEPAACQSGHRLVGRRRRPALRELQSGRRTDPARPGSTAGNRSLPHQPRAGAGRAVRTRRPRAAAAPWISRWPASSASSSPSISPGRSMCQPRRLRRPGP